MAADYGRDEGWFVYWRGGRIAELSEPKFTDMFWTSYELMPLIEDPDTLAAIYTDELWRHCEVTFRTRKTDLPTAHGAFASNAPVDSRISVRGLYVDGTLTLPERALLLLHRLGLVQ